MKERDTYPLFRKYIKEHPAFAQNTVWELKLCKGTSIPFSELAPHQELALRKAKHKGIIVKIPDQPHFKGDKKKFDVKKPFDFFYIKCPAYVVITFYKPYKPKVTCLIDIDKFIEERETCGRKSITPDRAKEIAENVIILPNS